MHPLRDAAGSSFASLHRMSTDIAMSTDTVGGRTPVAPLSTGPLRHVVSRHSIGIYFALTIVITWTVTAILLGPRSFPLTWERFESLGADTYLAFLTGPVIAGLAMIGAVHGRAGYRDLLARLRRWRVGPRVYALALLPAAVLAAVSMLLGLLSPTFVPAIVTADDKASMVLVGVAASILFGVGEELGWTGFATPRLLQRHGAIATGLIIGVIWGVWHFPLFWEADSFRGPLPMAILLARLFSWLPGFRILMVQLYAQTRSLLVPMLMHAALVTTQLVFSPARLTGTALLLDVLIYAIVTWVFVAAWAQRLATSSSRGKSTKSS